MNSAQNILDIAERQMRQRGYNAVSYRDLAGELGIKSASIHYHFPKKADLGRELVQRYAKNFQSILKTKTSAITDPAKRLNAFVDIYRQALTHQKLVCLCAVLGAEAPGLPNIVTDEVKAFFEFNIQWLNDVYSDLLARNPELRAKSALAALEGAMVIASVNDDMDVFEAAAQSVMEH